ncbi:MAG TPA: hypothetical protein VH912_22990 [Streptosporangiaceae bacterium]|jgi:hypothetical protein
MPAAVKTATIFTVAACALLVCAGCGDLAISSGSSSSSTSAAQPDNAGPRQTFAALSCHVLNLRGQSVADKAHKGLIVRAWGVDYLQRPLRVLAVISWENHAWEAHKEKRLETIGDDGYWMWTYTTDPDDQSADSIKPPGDGDYKVNVEVYNEANNDNLGSATSSCKL